MCVAEEPCEEDVEAAEGSPAVVVEEVPGGWLAGGQGYSSQVLLCNDRTDLKQIVGDERKVAPKMGAGKSSIFPFFSTDVFKMRPCKLR